MLPAALLLVLAQLHQCSTDDDLKHGVLLQNLATKTAVVKHRWKHYHLATIQPRMQTLLKLNDSSLVINVCEENLAVAHGNVVQVCGLGMLKKEKDKIAKQLRVNTHVNHYATYATATFHNKANVPVSLWDCTCTNSVERNLGSNEAVVLVAAPESKFVVTRPHLTEGCGTGSELHSFSLDDSMFQKYEYIDESCEAQGVNDEAAVQGKKEYLLKTGRDWVTWWPRGPPSTQIRVAAAEKLTSQVSTGAPSSGQIHGDIILRAELLTPILYSARSFLSDVEAEHIISLAKEEFKTGNGIYQVPRNTDHVLQTLYLRAASVFGTKGEEQLLNPKMQLERYKVGEGDAPHFDWGTGLLNNLATLIIQLNDVESGGEVVFPLGVGDATVHVPKKGSALLLYNLLEDGNGDMDAQYAALPVEKGERWVAKFFLRDGFK